MSDNSNDRAATSDDRRKTRQSKSALEQLRALLSRRRLRDAVEITEDHILSILIARRGREGILGRGLFSDPAWDALLELYAASLGERAMSLVELATAIDTPESTTARWIAELADRGLVASEPDMGEPSRLRIRLTAEGLAKMKQLIAYWGSAFLSI